MLKETKNRVWKRNINRAFITAATALASGDTTQTMSDKEVQFFTYNSSNRRWESTTSAISTGTPFFIGQRVDSEDGNHFMYRSHEIDIAEYDVNKQEYVAPVKQVSYIGYDDVNATGSLGITTLTKNDSFVVNIKNLTELTYPADGFTFQYVATSADVTAASSTSEDFVIAQKLASKISNDDNAAYHSYNQVRRYIATVSSNATGSAFSASATVAAVKGATTLTTSAAHGVGVGDYVSLGGDVYQAVTGTTGTTLVLDQPYRGETATIANADTVDAGATVPSEVGIKITTADVNVEEIFSTSTRDDLDVATVSDAVVGRVTEAGSYKQVKGYEEFNSINLGYTSKNTMHKDSYPQAPELSEIGAFYSVYTLTRKTTGINKKDWDEVPEEFVICCKQTNATTPSALNAAIDTVLGL